jgi:uncharacterized protein (TIGR03083 family)
VLDAVPTTRDELWAAVHTERAALADDLQSLTPHEWARPSLCGGWTVEDVVAHLSAAAGTGRVAWWRSMLAARFDADVHNRRRLTEQRGETPTATLDRFRALIPATTGPTGDVAAWLGEVVVHAQDIRRPLGIPHEPPVSTVTAVAEFFARRDFTVNSRTQVKGLSLRATDGPFRSGEGPEVEGSTVALTMAMAGRAVFCEELSGPGVDVLRGRHPDPA